MIFGTGLFIFAVAYLATQANKPKEAGALLSSAGLFGLLLILISICMQIAKVMP